MTATKPDHRTQSETSRRQEDSHQARYSGDKRSGARGKMIAVVFVPCDFSNVKHVPWLQNVGKHD